MASGKRTGRKSQASNDFLAPQTPVSVTATDVGTDRAFDNGAASVAFSLPVGSPAATSFTVTATSAGETTRTATGSTSPITVTNLKSDKTYSVTVIATNASGTSAASSATTVTATTVPATPSAPTAATPSAGVDRVTWTAPANGGKAISSYVWLASDAKTGSTTSTTVDVSQEQGSAQTYTVRALNANGTSIASAASNSVTTTFSFAPFGAFGFSPFGFSPFGAFGFSPFGAFGFSPFGFSPFGFSPFAFSPGGGGPYPI